MMIEGQLHSKIPVSIVMYDLKLTYWKFRKPLVFGDLAVDDAR